MTLSCLYAVGGKPTWLLSTMDSQLEAVRQDIHAVKEKVERTERNMTAAEQAGNREKERSLSELLLSLNNQLNGLQEKENILLRSQAPSKPCLWLVHAGLPHHAALHSHVQSLVCNFNSCVVMTIDSSLHPGPFLTSSARVSDAVTLSCMQSLSPAYS